MVLRCTLANSKMLYILLESSYVVVVVVKSSSKKGILDLNSKYQYVWQQGTAFSKLIARSKGC